MTLIVAIDPAGPNAKTGIAVFKDDRCLLTGASKMDATRGIEEFLLGVVRMEWPCSVPFYVEEPGDWMRAVKASRNLISIVQVQRAIGAWMALTGAHPVPDSDVKETITGRRNAPKRDVHANLRLMGYEFTDPNEADAIALGHHVSSKKRVEELIEGGTL